MTASKCAPRCRRDEWLRGLSLAELDFAPTVILRFSADKLLDVGAEFQPYYDREIARFEGELNRDELRDFKNSEETLN